MTDKLYKIDCPSAHATSPQLHPASQGFKEASVETEWLRLETQVDAALDRGDLAVAEETAQAYLRKAAVRDPSIRGIASNPWFRARYLAGQVSLLAGRLSQAIERFEPLLPFHEELPPVLSCRLALLAAETYLRQEDLPQAQIQRQIAESHLDSLRDQPMFFLRYLRLRLLMGEVQPLQAELKDCRERLSHDPVNLFVLYCDEGRAWDRGGDLNKAQNCWRAAFETATSLKDPVRQAEACLLLGSAAHRYGRLQQALTLLEQAAKLGSSIDWIEVEAETRQLEVLLDLNLWEQAELRHDRLLEKVSLEQLPEETQRVVNRLGQLLKPGRFVKNETELRAYRQAQVGDWEQARRLYVRVLEESACFLDEVLGTYYVKSAGTVCYTWPGYWDNPSERDCNACPVAWFPGPGSEVSIDANGNSTPAQGPWWLRWPGACERAGHETGPRSGRPRGEPFSEADP